MKDTSEQQQTHEVNTTERTDEQTDRHSERKHGRPLGRSAQMEAGGMA